MQEQLSLPIDVISSRNEAHLAFHSVRRRFDLEGKNTLVTDIGGGSTEIVLASGEMIEAIYTTTLGAVRVMEKFGSGHALAGDDFSRMQKWIDRELKRTTEKPFSLLHLLIGTGGTFTNLASMVMTSRGQSRLPIAGCQVSRAELRHLIDRLRKMPLKQRREMQGLSPDRADIIVPGLTTIDRIMRRFKVNLLQVHTGGVRDGLLLSMIERLQGGGEPPNIDVQTQIECFAIACGVELDDLPLLEAAGLMQDVGYLINYEGYHKHSYHLILHSRLEGFRPDQLDIVANVARYHRGEEPKNKHENFGRLSETDQHRVRTMAAVLRLASGLDRSHNQTIQAVGVHGGKKQIELVVDAAEFPEVDLWAARRRAGLFEKLFDTEVTIQWAGHVAAATNSTS